MSNIKHRNSTPNNSTSNIKHRIFNTGIQYRIFKGEHSSFPQNVILNINLMPCLLAVGRSR